MAYRVEIAPAAAAQIRDAAAWWFMHRPEARYSMEGEVEAALEGLGD